MSNLAEGFERQHVPEKFQFYNVAHASIVEVRSLTYAIEDSYPKLLTEVIRLREEAARAGSLLGGLIRSTASHRSAL